MKKQNANNKLAFIKANVTELNDEQMYDVDGGTTPVCAATAASSIGCLRVASAVVAIAVAWALD